MRLAAFVLVAIVLAGCTSTPEAPREALDASLVVQTAPSLALAPDSTADVPAWAVGDAWVVETRNGDQTAEATLVVVAADAGGYVMASTNEEMATYDAAFDVSYLGKVRAGDLAGAQQGEPVRFFDFPLADGKTWSTTWDRVQVNLTATFSPRIPTPAGAQPGFAIVGTGPGGLEYVSYDFVPALGWWSRIDFAEGYGLTVKAVTHDWTGEYYAGTAKTLLTLATAAPVAGIPAGTFTVDRDQTTVLLTLVSASTHAYARGLAFVDPNHQPYNPEGVPNWEMQPGPSSTFLTAFLPPTPGEWQVGAPALHDHEGFFHLVVQEIALAKRTL